MPMDTAGDRYFQPGIETMPRAELTKLQTERILRDRSSPTDQAVGIAAEPGSLLGPQITCSPASWSSWYAVRSSSASTSRVCSPSPGAGRHTS